METNVLHFCRCSRVQPSNPGKQTPRQDVALRRLRTAQLYVPRWDIELCFRNLKPTMWMDELRCRTPQMARKGTPRHQAKAQTLPPADPFCNDCPTRQSDMLQCKDFFSCLMKLTPFCLMKLTTFDGSGSSRFANNVN